MSFFSFVSSSKLLKTSNLLLTWQLGEASNFTKKNSNTLLIVPELLASASPGNLLGWKFCGLILDLLNQKSVLTRLAVIQCMWVLMRIIAVVIKRRNNRMECETT